VKHCAVELDEAKYYQQMSTKDGQLIFYDNHVYSVVAEAVNLCILNEDSILFKIAGIEAPERELFSHFIVFVMSEVDEEKQQEFMHKLLFSDEKYVHCLDFILSYLEDNHGDNLYDYVLKGKL